MTFAQIDELVRKSSRPLEDEWLEKLQERLLGPLGKHNYYRFLYHLVGLRRPKFCLEIGVEFGFASAYMAAAASEYGGWVVGIDLDFHPIPGNEVPGRYRNYRYLVADSRKESTARLVRRFTHEYGKLGLVFQDSSHRYWDSKAEWELYSPFLDDGAVWVCDDLAESYHYPDEDPPGKGMAQYWEEIPAARKALYVDVLHGGNTMGVALL